MIERIGAMLTDRVRSGDVIGRIGGDEFAVLLRRVQPDEARFVACNVQELAIESLADVFVGEHEQVTLSVGVAAFGGPKSAGDIPTMDELFKIADAAMYSPSAPAATASPSADRRAVLRRA